jgi:hypothetical protein
LLKLEGLGFSQAEIVKELSQKNVCSKRTIYNDFEARATWQPIGCLARLSRDRIWKTIIELHS